ncbi:MAG TPA: M28 family peptidase, partial [Blastocatellia bacterium]|nr:M28 family peptidase [Blastocatellia bacterium]
MKINRPLIRLFAFMICFGLVWPLTWPIDGSAAQSRAKSGAQKKGGAKKRSRGKSRRSASRRARGRSDAAATPRPAFDKIMSANRALLSEATDADSASSQIVESKLRAHVKYLADDLLEGRGPGSRGGILAAKYIASQFEALGLEPAAADRSFFQQVQMIGTRTDPSTKLAVKSESAAAEFKFGDEFVAGTDLEQAEIPINGEIIFAGYGVNAPENNWDDYKGLDVRGKVLMIMVNDPPATPSEPNLFGGKALTYYGRWTYKYEEAARRGAAGVILIHTDNSAGYGWSVVRNSWGGARFGLAPEANTPSLKLKSWVTEETASKIAQLGGKDLNQLRQSAASRAFRPTPLGVSLNMTLRAQSQRMTSPNVVAIYRGNDPTLKNEYVVYSAHWDHLGVRPDQPGDNIYNGAVDNATGVAGIIAIANAFNSLAFKPRRSILFIATTAEEQG